MSVVVPITSLTLVQLPQLLDPRHVQSTTTVVTTTEMSHVQVTHAHSNTAAIDPAASVAIPQPNTKQELWTLAIPNENVNNYLDTQSM